MSVVAPGWVCDHTTSHSLPSVAERGPVCVTLIGSGSCSVPTTMGCCSRVLEGSGSAHPIGRQSTMQSPKVERRVMATHHVNPLHRRVWSRRAVLPLHLAA